MRYRLEVSDGAEADTLQAYHWYEDQFEDLGELFLKELEKQYKKLELSPENYSKVYKNYRQVILDRFPYVIVYEIKGLTVIIYAVFHTSRNPRTKFRRK